DPLTISDAYSRYLLRCQAVRAADYEHSKPVFEAAFREYGMPQRIRTDNGSPFGSNGDSGLTGLTVWWIKLGIRPEHIAPGKPQQNGRHERMHRTLKEETASPPASTRRRQQERFDEFRQQYNEQRPHEGLGQQTRASQYKASGREYPERLRGCGISSRLGGALGRCGSNAVVRRSRFREPCLERGASRTGADRRAPVASMVRIV